MQPQARKSHTGKSPKGGFNRSGRQDSVWANKEHTQSSLQTSKGGILLAINQIYIQVEQTRSQTSNDSPQQVFTIQILLEDRT